MSATLYMCDYFNAAGENLKHEEYRGMAYALPDVKPGDGAVILMFLNMLRRGEEKDSTAKVASLTLTDFAYSSGAETSFDPARIAEALAAPAMDKRREEVNALRAFYPQFFPGP